MGNPSLLPTWHQLVKRKRRLSLKKIDFFDRKKQFSIIVVSFDKYPMKSTSVKLASRGRLQSQPPEASMIGQNLNGTRDVRNSLINQSILCTEIKVDILNICSISNVIVAHSLYPFHQGDDREIPLYCRKLAKFRFACQAAF